MTACTHCGSESIVDDAAQWSPSAPSEPLCRVHLIESAA